MDFVKKIISGDDKSLFQNTKWAECIVTGNKDDVLVVNKTAMAAIRMHYHDVVSLVGPPGVGKSTLASTIYNTLRGNRVEYFKGSNCMEGFTKGVWALRERVKAPFNDKDLINVLDLEGLEDKDIIHYFVVVAITLSKAVLLMANYNGSPRIKFDIFKTLQAGIRVYKKNNIRIPRPIVYIQVPFNKKKGRIKTKFELNGAKMSHAQLIEKIKEEYPDLKEFEIRLFGLPIFDNGNDADSDSDSSDDEDEVKNGGYNNDARFDDQYVKTVKALIDELKNIDESVRMEHRVIYADKVVSALNENQPAIVINTNLKHLKAEIDKYSNEIKSNRIATINHDAQAKANKITKMIGYEEFCKLVCPPDGKYRYGKDIKARAIKSPYYSAELMQHRKIIQELDDEKKYYIEVKNHCRDIYNIGKRRMRAKLVADAETLMRVCLQEFELFLDGEIGAAAAKIERDGDTKLPDSLRSAAKDNALQLKSDIEEKTQYIVEVPSDYFNMDILEMKWKAKVDELQAKWNKLKK